MLKTSHTHTHLFRYFVLSSVIFLSGWLFSASASIPQTINSQSNTLKAGSVLVFPYYNSDGTVGNINTRISISNVGAEQTNMHLFFLRGNDCVQADMFICPTPNGSTVFDVNSFDPGTRGWILGIAVDEDGNPTQANRFIGNAFVRDGDMLGNYNAEAFSKLTAGSVASTDGFAPVRFNSSEYDGVPIRHRVELLSPSDAQQTIVTVSLNGDIAYGFVSAGAKGVSQWYNEDERLHSGPAWSGGCQNIFPITNAIRTVPRLDVVIPTGRTGQVAFATSGTVGLLFTMTRKPDGSLAPYSGIRPVHNTTLGSASLIIPVFMPTC